MEDNKLDKIFLIADNTNWYELAFSDLGAWYLHTTFETNDISSNGLRYLFILVI